MKSDERKAPEIAVALGGCVTRLAALMNFNKQRSGKVSKRIHAAVVMAAVAASLITGGSARAQSVVMAVDTANRKVHVAGNANQKRAVGGLAKIATTMVVLDWSEASKVGLNVLATVPDYAERIAGQTYLGLQPGDKLTLRDLIYATMMGSDNVAAITLGHFVGADLLARKGKAGDPLAEFVRNMNALAEREGCTNTQFMNPHGFENTRPLPYSTAADIARIALYATSRAPFHFFANQPTRSITIYRNGQQTSQKISNTNSLLGTDRIDGIKTGNTPASGGCVAITADRPATVVKQDANNNLIYRHRMIVVVIGSADPFGEARGILRQAWQAYDVWMNAGRPVTDQKQLITHF